MENEELGKEVNQEGDGETKDISIEAENNEAPEAENIPLIEQAYHSVPPKPRSISKRKLTLIISIIVFVSLLLWSGIIFAVLYGLNQAGSAKTYTISGESVPSIMSVVGERKFQSYSSSINPINGSAYKKYTYRSVKNVEEDLRQYATTLFKEEGFLLTKDCDLTKPTGAFQIAKQSELDDDKIIIIDFNYSLGTYTIHIQRGLGHLTPKN